MRAEIGYEIFVDRFFSSQKKNLTIPWDSEITGHEKQEYDFYGGDLLGITEKIDYLYELGIDFIYLTPIFEAKTNHRYDCTNYFKIDPLIGNEQNLELLCKSLAQKNIKLFLDIALNHMSSDSIWFQKAVTNNNEHNYFRIKGGEFTHWANVEKLVELNLENLELQSILWDGNNSAMKYWSKFGIAGWRLDCAYELGYDILNKIYTSLKEQFHVSLIGEIWSYPEKWIQEGVLDGIMNYYYKDLIDNVIDQKIDGTLFTQIVEKLYVSCGNKLLKSWNILSSHDTSRIRTRYGKNWKIAVALQFMLPGSPLIYYGEEIGLEAEGDPYCRTPMKWNSWSEENYESYNFYKKMIKFFENSKALQEGSLKAVFSNNKNIVSFLRTTDSIEDLRLVVANPTSQQQNYLLYTQESSLMNNTILKDCFSNNIAQIENSKIIGQISPNSFSIFMPHIERDTSKYTPYKRIY